MHLSIISALTLVVVAAAQDSVGLVKLLQSQEDLSTLLSAVQSVPGLAETLAGASNITILAPTNEAFKAIPSNSSVGAAIAGNDTDVIGALLSYHVLQGNFTSDTITKDPAFAPTLLNSTAFANVTGGQVVQAAKSGKDVVFTTGGFAESTVTQADIIAGGITVHKIDTVLSIPQNSSATALGAGLTSLAGALTDADLVRNVDTLNDLTVFAPNNAAFQAVGSAFANADIQTLQGVLSYHIVRGSVLYSPDITNTTVKTHAGTHLTLTVVDGSVFVNGAKVVTPNVLVANGVVHVIDSVLNPNTTSAPSQLDPSASPSPAYSGASSVTEVPFTSGLPAAAVTISAPSASGSASGSASLPTSSEAASAVATTPAATSAISGGGAGRSVATGMAGAVGVGALFAGAWVGF